MAVTRYQDLVCWQLADELKNEVYALIDRTSAKTDIGFCGQLRNAASSASANISEAFGYYRHRESARHARIARSSLIETHNHLCDGVKRCGWTDNDIAPLLMRANRAIGATTRWLEYLSTTETPPSHWDEKRPRPPRRRRS